MSFTMFYFLIKRTKSFQQMRLSSSNGTVAGPLARQSLVITTTPSNPKQFSSYHRTYLHAIIGILNTGLL